jgi:hypothetical protein
MVLYASYVCLLHSRLIKNHPINLEPTDASILGGSITTMLFTSAKNTDRLITIFF